MRENLWSSHGLVFSQPVLLALVAAGATRDDAYRIVQRNAMKAWEERRDFRTLLEDDPDVTLSKTAMDDAFDLERSLRHLDRVAAALDRAPPAGLTGRRAAAQDARLMPASLQHGRLDADLAPRRVRDVLALAVGLGDLHERRLDRPEVDRAVHRLQLGGEVALLLDEAQLAQRVGVGQLGVDRGEPLLDRIRRPLAASLGLVGAQRVEVVTHGLALGSPLGEGSLVLRAHRSFASTLRRHAVRIYADAARCS